MKDGDVQEAISRLLIGQARTQLLSSELLQLSAHVEELFGLATRETVEVTPSAYWETVTLIRSISDLQMTLARTLKVLLRIGRLCPDCTLLDTHSKPPQGDFLHLVK